MLAHAIKDIGHGKIPFEGLQLVVARSATQVDVDGLPLAPGFIQHAELGDRVIDRGPASQSDIRQGVTLEVFGEGTSMGPLEPHKRATLTVAFITV